MRKWYAYINHRTALAKEKSAIELPSEEITKERSTATASDGGMVNLSHD